MNRARSLVKGPPWEGRKSGGRLRGRLILAVGPFLRGQEDAREWLKERNFAPGNEVPLMLATTEAGAKLVEAIASSDSARHECVAVCTMNP